MNIQRGFTLIELVVVILLLGILAAIALPKFISLQSDARRATLNGTAGSIRSAVALVQGVWYAKGATGSTVTLSDGSTVTVGSSGTAKGIPLSTTGGIQNAVTTSSDLTYTPGASTGTYNFNPVVGTNCNVVYTGATGTVVVNNTDC